MTNEHVLILEKINQKAIISPHLKEAINEIINAINVGDIELAYELSVVKSFVTGGMDHNSNEHHFRENHEYNENVLGRSVYGELDSIHFDLAMSLKRMPSGMMILSANGMTKKGEAKREHPIILLIKSEREAIRNRVRDL